VLVLFFSPLFVFYLLVIQLRRLRYRRLAGNLSAQYVSQGLFRTGRIVGRSGGEEFTIETFVRGARPSHFYTSVSMACNTDRIDFATDPPASSGIHIRLRAASVPLEQSRDPKIREVLAGFVYDAPSLRRGSFYAQGGHVKWETRGILADHRQVEMVVPLIQRIAKAVEALPVS
jgi:hypothetical protein